MEIEGRIIQILPLQEGVSANGNWKKQEYVLETNAQYPKKVCFGIFVGATSREDRIATSNIQLGEELKVYIDIDSREYQGRWYTSVSAWKVERLQAIAQADPSQGGFTAPFPPADPFSGNDGGNSSDDLPF